MKIGHKLVSKLYTKIANQISDSVRNARVDLGFTRNEVSKGAGVSVQFLHKLENGEAVSLKQICAVAEYLGLSPNELLDGKQSKEDSLEQQILEEVLS